MKVLFLDIDGVMTTVGAPLSKHYKGLALLEKPVCLLLDLLRETDAKIVLSSDWRRYKSNQYLCDTYLKPYGLETFYYDKTGNEVEASRGIEIQKWLAQHPEVSSFVILDDRSDIAPYDEYWINVDEKKGLSEENVKMAKFLLQTSKIK